MTVGGEVLAIFQERGAGAYFGAPVSIAEHSLQTAFWAQAENASPPLIFAALLHDIGHLIDDVPADLNEWTADARHEEVAGRWLARRFGPTVSEPVRLHVPAKRYLCAVDPSYFSKLSAASVATLKLQGGPMSAREVLNFERERFHQDAVRVRRWDDRGKIAGFATGSFADYRALIEELASVARQ